MENVKHALKSANDALCALFRRVDPLRLMAIVAFRYVLPETSERTPVYREYLLGVAAAVAEAGLGEPTDHDATCALALAQKVIDSTAALRMLSDVQRRARGTIDELSFAALQKSLYERGDSYERHEEALIRRLFEPHDAWLGSASRPRVQDFLENVSQICQWQLQSQLNLLRQASSVASPPTPFAMLNSLEISPAGVAQSLLREIAIVVGTDAQLLEEGPLANPMICRPLVQHGNKFYCFDRGMLARSRRLVLERWLSEDSRYYEKTFCPARGRVTEDLVVEAFQQLLPGARVLRQIYYRAEVAGEQRRCELDLLAIYDDRMFIVEVKGGAVTPAAARGAAKRLERTLGDLVDEPYRQALRAKAHMESAESADCLEFKDGSPVTGVPTIRGVRGVYVATVTLYDLVHATGQLSRLRELGLLKGQDWPWSVFVNDLRVVSEVLQSPAEFVLYLERRARINDQSVFATTDELDYLGAFLSNGLYFENNEFNGAQRVILGGSTEDLDQYYERGIDDIRALPRFAISDWYRSFVASIENSGAAGRTEVAKTLLSLASSGQLQVEGMVRQAEEQVAVDGRSHDATVIGDQLGGVCVTVTPRLDDSFRESRRAYARMKRRQMRLDRFSLVMIQADQSGRPPEIEIFEGPHKEDALLDAQVRLFSHARIAHAGRIERNQPCPCNSGRKYKKCCLDKGK